jgi:hypothetical protein
VLDDYTDRSGPLRVLWPSSRHLAPKLRVFVDFLAANLVPHRRRIRQSRRQGISSNRATICIIWSSKKTFREALDWLWTAAEDADVLSPR